MAAIKEYAMNNKSQDDNSSSVDKLFERSILEIDIPPCPVILTRFMQELKKSGLNFNQLAGIIEADVAISASLIKTANSPFFGLSQRVRSVKEAIAILGLNATSRALAGIILRDTFPHMRLERFWDASARIARLSGWLATHFRIPGLLAEDAYTFGLFRDCGIPILLKRFPQYNKVLDSANHDTEHNFVEVEEGELPTNHAMVGCLMAQSWWLPEEINLAIRNHHDLTSLNVTNSEIPVLSRQLVAIAQLAEHIVQHHYGLSLTEEWGKLGESCLQLVGIDAVQLEMLYAEVTSIDITEG
jgi:HD-like signal output (HDOD) protein